MKHSDFIESLRPFANFVTHCPEVEIGLGVPRKFIRIVIKKGERKLIQPATKRDYTKEIIEYTDETIGNLEDIDGFVLKTDSPSCSISRVRYYESEDRKARIVTEGSGFFGGAIVEEFQGIPIESDGRLRNGRIRETFLTKVFMITDLRRVRKSRKMKELVDFHSKNKYLIMSFGQKYVSQLGKIVANPDKKSFHDVMNDYSKDLALLMNKTPRSTSMVNVMTKLYGYFSNDLSKREKDLFYKKIDSFRKGVASLTSLRELLKVWAVRFDERYVENQSVFQPFPEELNTLCDVVSFQED
jgi:uncharacterized protein YbgA (DUF1722 family)/uncharacterized protein YbbK (DUF523 family)